MKNNPNLIILIGTVVVIIVLCLGGCHLYNKGYQAALTVSKMEKVEKKIVKDDTAVAYWKERALKVSDSLKDKNKAYDFLLFIDASFQTKANQQRTSYEKTIKSLSDSIKNFKIDSTQLAGGDDNLLIAEHDYPIALAQLDTCNKDKEIWKLKYEGSQLELNICRNGSNAKDTLATDTKSKTDLTESISDNKVSHKNFWIFTGWGTAVGQTIGAGYLWIKGKLVLK